MTYAGARGKTEKQMVATLRFPIALEHIWVDRRWREIEAHISKTWPQKKVHPAYAELLKQLKPGKKAGYELHVANALWGQKGYPWLKEFLATTKDNYGAGLREVDFKTKTEAARQTINKWVEEQTKEKIKDLLAKGILTPLTRLVLTNAIYFKGDWASQFDKKRTREANFTCWGVPKGARVAVKVPMMNQTEKFGYAETKDLQALRMAYAGKELSMVIVLPKKVGDLTAVEKSLVKGGLKDVLKNLRDREVRVLMPKFKMESEFRLDKTLKAMGMTDAFSEKADFSGMNGRKYLFISAVVHKAFVDVNEEGTEAAAATAVIAEGLIETLPPVFRADHPFIFLIRHEKTGAILFVGRVMNPKA
jgi:serpin B